MAVERTDNTSTEQEIFIPNEKYEEVIEEKQTLKNEKLRVDFVPQCAKSKCSDNQSNDERKWKDLFVVMSVLDILLLLFGIAIIVVWRFEVDKLTLEQTDNFCLPCDKIRVHKDDDWFNFRLFHLPEKQENGTKICCTDSESNLDKLVELFVDRHHRQKRAKEPLMNGCVGKMYDKNFRKPVVKLAGITRTHREKYSSIVHWDNTSPQSFIGPSDKIEYKDGRITIGYDAYYFVYSQITFKEIETPKPDDGQTLAIHFIYQKRRYDSHGTKRPIIKSSDTQCELQEQSSNSTSHIGAVAYLHAGDEIGVIIKHGNVVTTSPYSNFFGIQAI